MAAMTEKERDAYAMGLRAGVGAVLAMIAEAYGKEYAERIRPDAEAYADMIESKATEHGR